MKTQHWIYSFAETNLGFEEQSQCTYRPHTMRAMFGQQRPTMTALFKNRIRGLHALNATDDGFIGHA